MNIHSVFVRNVTVIPTRFAVASARRAVVGKSHPTACHSRPDRESILKNRKGIIFIDPRIREDDNHKIIINKTIMIQKISAPVSVQTVFDHRKRSISPRQILWDGKIFRIAQVGLHHTFREGRTLFHIFSVTAQGFSFRLRLDTDSLFWTLEEISDGLAN